MLQSLPIDGAGEHVGEGPDARARADGGRLAQGVRVHERSVRLGHRTAAASASATRSCWAAVR